MSLGREISIVGKFLSKSRLSRAERFRTGWKVGGEKSSATLSAIADILHRDTRIIGWFEMKFSEVTSLMRECL
jgi:hypothetical protein